MNKTRRIGAVVAATVAATGMAMTVSAAPASAASTVKGPRPVSQVLGTVGENDATWVQVRFATDRKVCDFALRVRGVENVDVTYPSGRTFTSLNDDDTLRKHEVDHAAFRLSTGDFAADTWRVLHASVSYTHCGPKALTHTKRTRFLVRVDAA